jgi:hypothetical protein
MLPLPRAVLVLPMLLAAASAAPKRTPLKSVQNLRVEHFTGELACAQM